jgi:protocatechuate 3,4-dioxygenase beta subunit
MSRSSLPGFLLLAPLILTINVPAQVSSGAASAPAGVISGRVTTGGKPARPVAIILEPFGPFTPKSPLPSAITDNEGKYRIAGVPEGQYVVKPFAPALVILSVPDSNKAGMTMGSSIGLSGFIVTVAKGDILDGIDFALGAGGVITGRVTDDAGRPVIAVSVECQRVNEQGQPASGSSRVETDDRGIYRIYALPEGKYLVSVYDSRRFSSGPDRRTFYRDANEQARATGVQVSAGAESTGIDIRVGQTQETYRITGRLMAQDTGKPVTGAFINFRGSNTEGYLETNSEGGFKIDDCVPGNYEVKIATTGGPTRGYYSDPLTIQVTDADVADVEIRAIPGVSVGGNVIVLGSKDPSIVNALAQSFMSATDLKPGNYAIAGAAVIGAGGRFDFAGIRPGRILFQPSSLPEGFTFLRVERDGVPVPDGLTLSAGESVTGLRVIVAYGTGSINGQIKVEGGVLPTRMNWDLCVRRADGEGQELRQMIDARGHFWVKNLPPGLYEITAEAQYVEIPGVTPSPFPAPTKQTVTVQNKAESQVLMVLDLKGRGKQ